MNYSKKAGTAYTLVQVILLFTIIGLLIVFGVDTSSVTRVISIAFDLMALLMIIIVSRSCLNGRLIRSSACFFKLMMSTYLCLFFESCSWIIDGHPKAVALDYATNIGCNCFMLICAYLFYDYVCISCNCENSGLRKRIVQILVAVAILAEVLNIRFGYFYTIRDTGEYVRSSGWEIAAFIPFIVIVAFCCQIIFKAHMEIRQTITYLLYGFIPFAVSIWYTLTGYPPTFFVALFFSLMLIYSNIYVVQGKEIQKSEIKIAKQKNQMALSQIRPHFLYNALGSIEVLCKTNPQKAGEAVHFFSRYLRMNMDALGDVDMIPFSKELEHIHNYIWLEKMRFDEDLEYTESIEVSDFMIPVLAIQPLVENAVKHGMMGMDEGVLHVDLSTYEKDDCYYIRIKDDGAGFDMNAPKNNSDERSHLGMTNAKERIKSFLNGEFIVDSHVGQGTTITIVTKR